MLAVISLAIFAILIVPEHSLAEIGRTRISKEVANDFESYRFDSSYRYYFVDLVNNPSAVIGLQNDYTVHDISWTEVNPNSEKFRHVIDLVKLFPKAKSRAFGADILDAQGKKIGVYYSSTGAGVVVNNDNKTVSMMIRMSGPQRGGK